MSDLGIFIDESGDVGSNSEFYLITLIFHNQDFPILEQVSTLSRELCLAGYPEDLVIHSGPIIRKEEIWKDIDLARRRKVFFKMFSFLRLCPIKYKSFGVIKKECQSSLKLKGRLANEIGMFLSENLSYFQDFDKIIVYYDNGQTLVTDLINTVLCSYLNNVDVRKIRPEDYRLSQAADMVCTLELMQQKINNSSGMSRSEEIFFESKRRLCKIFLKSLSRLQLKK